MAGGVIDKALQILGRRGYMRVNPVERLYRDIRVDRFREGTSEIERMVIAEQIKTRGVGVFADAGAGARAPRRLLADGTGWKRPPCWRPRF